MKARVFVSCGQRKESDEVKVANDVARRLDELGYDPYVAGHEQTLRGIRENIFAQLESSEYFVFIDFKREQLANRAECRGSLFSHQELAIASYLELPVIAFQQEGVLSLDGLLGFIQANCRKFTSPDEVSDLLTEEITKAQWSPGWKNELFIEFDPAEISDANVRNVGNRPAHFFPLKVCNRHLRKIAVNCTGYLYSVRTVPGEPMILRTVEMKWGGYEYPTVNILPASHRVLDGFFVFHDAPQKPEFNCLTDSSRYYPNLNGPGTFEFTYLIASENFRQARVTFRVTLGTDIGHVVIEPVRQEVP